ncbi:hypothetical protein C8F04DRAFT_1233674 [Mycena alexandri]|uniref:Glucose-methanol-choline oxidoreductase N-terminal domain-containing protein n=1 Tax=Mycena alexandri TaxID=1745969 RepID=A0AAD6T019_9AGAR|nr:hypothetical protein C8F04DRAFT_1233674 [Mycena alexandri]
MARYDIIFAGGGSTACVIAGRLAAADSSLRILACTPFCSSPIQIISLSHNYPFTGCREWSSDKRQPIARPARAFLENITITPPENRGDDATLHSSVPGVNLGGRAATAANEAVSMYAHIRCRARAYPFVGAARYTAVGAMVEG